MAKSRREKPHGGPEREGSGVSKSTGDESKAPRTETKNERRRREKEELLCQIGWPSEDVSFCREGPRKPFE
jgi:hypothetical protein